MRLDHLISLASYGGNGYQIVNRSLRNQTVREDNVAPFVNCLDRALQLLPKFRGTVYRYVSYYPPNVDVQYVEGGIVKELTYTSTSKRRDLYSSLTSEKKSRGYTFTIRGKTGRELGWMVTGEDTEEVLFPRGTCFKIDRRRESEGEAWHSSIDLVDRYIEIHMHEVACP